MQIKVISSKDFQLHEKEERVTFLFTPSEGENINEISIDCSREFESIQVVNLGERGDKIATFLIRQNK